MEQAQASKRGCSVVVRLTMKQLIRNLGDQFNLPVSTIKNLNLDHFVDQAIKVEAGEIPSLRPPPIDDKVFLLDTAVDYADDENEEPWIPNPTPPSNSLNDFAMEPVIRSEQSDSPATVLLDVLEKQEEAQPSVHELTPEPEQDQATTPVPEPVPEPESELLPLLVLEHELELEPSALIVERSPTIDLPVDMNQQQQEEEAEPESLQQSELKHEPEQEPEPEPQISQQKAPSPQQDSTPDLPMDIPMHRRRDYSEEAWRRYERYQKRRQSRQSELSTPDSESGARDESQHPISSKRQHQQRSSTQASSGEHRRRSMKS
ncbi:TWiK family of potassium channels protein 9 [Toxocara canis]|uniref:TWiK family of potassium channels protein 9 n=1 Tax=Toxocara canis TaxID=6265 RepID=A0A0B2V8W7_TOXCA|nr:TWiK family of potassium channels protein 9 [Toxocara canis]